MKYKMHTGEVEKIFLKLCVFFEMALLSIMLYVIIKSGEFGTNLDFWFIAAIPIIAYVCVVAFIRGVFRLFSVSIFENGIYSPGTSFVFRVVTWDEIIGANLMCSSGLRYIAIRSNETNRQISMPLDIIDIGGFLENLRNLAGEDHVLTIAVRDSISN